MMDTHLQTKFLDIQQKTYQDWPISSHSIANASLVILKWVWFGLIIG